MSKMQMYQRLLRETSEWIPFLLKESGLPGPRGNLELLYAVVQEGTEEQFADYITFDPIQAPTNSPQEFIAACGAAGLGKLIAEGNLAWQEQLRALAADPRWRVREAVAMALQVVGEADMERLLREIEGWSKGNLLEKRAVVAALCEPKLLRKPEVVLQVLELLNDITASILAISNRRDENFRVSRKALGYGWSVAYAAQPELGQRYFEGWMDSVDSDIRWIFRENLKKARLRRINPQWAEQAMSRFK